MDTQFAAILADLKNRTPEVRENGAKELFRVVQSWLATHPPEAAPQIWNEVNQKILFPLTAQSTNTYERLGGIAAIDKLRILESEATLETKRNLFRLLTYVKHVLPTSEMPVMTAAAATFGKILQVGGPSFTGSVIEMEVQRAWDLMTQDKTEHGRFAGVVILTEIATYASAQFFAYVNLTLEKVVTPLRDPRETVRKAAASLLSKCLAIVAAQERGSKPPIFMYILNEAQKGVKSTYPEVIQGSLLIYRELLMTTNLFMEEYFIDTCEKILGLKTHKDVAVRKTVTALLPVCARYDAMMFNEHFLHKAMAWLLPQLSKSTDKQFVLETIGPIALSVTSEMKQFMPEIMAQVKECLAQRGKKGSVSDKAIFECIRMLAAAVGPNLTKLLHDQLDLIFANEFNEHVCNSLAACVVSIPPLLGAIQDRLLDKLTIILSGQSYRPTGAPMPVTRPEISLAQIAASTSQNIPKSTETIQLALETLATFDFSGYELSDVVRTCALPYLEDETSEIRLRAAITCCQLFMREPGPGQRSICPLDVINEVLEKLLTASIADTDANIRVTVLSNLDERFDKHLAQAEHVRLLFMAMNDEMYDVRFKAVAIIGRLGFYNPADLMPSLRKTLIQLLTELEYVSSTPSRNTTAEFFTALIKSTERLIKPYTLALLKVVLPKASDANPIFSRHMIECIGLLAVIGGDEITPHVPEMMRIIISTLQDGQTPAQKRDTALITLGQVCANTAYVVDPIIDHPELLAILARMLKTDTTAETRREVLRVLGILGAVDPYVRRKRLAQDDSLKDPAVRQMTASFTMSGMSSDEYFQTVAMSALLNILNDNALASQHLGVIDAIMTIFKLQGLKCNSFLVKIIPAFISVTRLSNARHQDHYLQQMALLVEIVKSHIQSFTRDILDMCRDLWANQVLHLPLITLIENLSKVLAADFKPHVPAVLPLLLSVSEATTDKRQAIEIKAFQTYHTFGSNVEEYMHLLLPVLLAAVESPDTTSNAQLKRTALTTVAGLARRVNLSDYASRIIHPLIRVIPDAPQDVRDAIKDTMCTLVFQLGADFAVFVPMVKKCLLSKRIHWPKYEQLITKLLNGERLPIEQGYPESWVHASISEPIVPTDIGKLNVNQQHLKHAWDISNVVSREDWQEWFKNFSTELLRESTSPALRACATLVEAHPPLGLDLFNAAFISCWTELYSQYQEDLVPSITLALTTNRHADLTLILLNLVEFMEHEGCTLPIDIGTLGRVAEQATAYAKAMHYKELEYFEGVSPELVESLVSISTKLQLHDVAWAILKTNTVAEELKLDRWYERLGRWSDALEAYDDKLEDDSESQETLLGRMRCLYALGEWEPLNAAVDANWGDFSNELRKEIAPLASAASFNLYQWDMMEEHVSFMSSDLPDRFFYRAVLAVHRNQFQKADSAIAKARDILQSDLAGLEDYTRVYGSMIRVQLLSELEEIIHYKRNADQPERLEIMRKTWSKRLQGCQRDIDVWQKILQLRGLVLEPEDDVDSWIRLANLCRKSGRMHFADKALRVLMDGLPMASDKAPPAVVYSILKVNWAKGLKQESLDFLRKFCLSLAGDIGSTDVAKSPDLQKNRRLLARSFLKQGEWQSNLTTAWTPEVIGAILNSHQSATEYAPDWSKAWHSWALCNFEVINHLEEMHDTIISSREESLLKYVLAAIKGFFRSIALRSDNPLQDSLRILTLWFKFAAEERVTLAVNEGASMVSVDTWLDVVPQLIARIQTQLSAVRVMVNTLLTDVGRAHPQALIYPLTVASKSASHTRKAAATLVMDRLRDHSPRLVEQSLTVSHELIRIAMLWHELWHEHLEEASRLYFTEKNADAMIDHLESLHQLMDQGPQTSRETSFLQVYGRDLRDARDACMRYRRYRDSGEMDRAWELYYGVFRRIERQLPQLTVLDLQHVSPNLLAAQDLELAVPGTYRAGKPTIRISKFSSKLSVISSKQRPRRLSIIGSDEVEYQFLLKGHEDLRQDERVMQLFGLVNTLLAVDNDSFMRNLHIRRYAVIPLAANVGLLQWVLHSDTLHILIKDYRDSQKILLNFEYRLMLQMAPDYPSLTLLQKVEVFRYALDNTTGLDLYKVLWLKSANSAAWLERRSTFTRSLAVNSMVGHILGLGDRHPSNVMIERNTGQVIHIDFGDCFEVAMHREKFPEKIPFRLTRMLTNAMEVSGIEGNFRTTAQISMRVLRDNKDSLLAVLEAFVYDPLISWRLTAGQEGHGDTDPKADQSKIQQFAGGPNRKLKADENDIFDANGELKMEGRNEKAWEVYSRVQKKLTGRDFDPEIELSVEKQVEELIIQATAVENLCQCFLGWCAFW
ncbi:phosphatidylinositol kinase- protein kinase tor1 [Serendipita sp. 401]|nr:phosphatidylinositol kinase- protein kinase tor1 [Serendipita sp. 401]